MKFPKRILHRGRVLATIYKPKNYPFYRVAWSAAGKRTMKAFPRYGEAKKHADELVKGLAKGSQVPALTAGQARDALAAFQRLQDFYQKTGRKVSLLCAVSEFCESSAKLHGRTLNEAVEGYTRTEANVKRKDLKAAVEEMIQSNAPKTRGTNGERAQISSKYNYNRELQLRRFADTFLNTAVCELSKEHLDTFIQSLSGFAAKSRNHYRATVRQFLQWAVRKDYITVTHRLLEADKMHPERANTAETEFYTPKEFRSLLENADETLRPLIAIGGLAGLRTAELLRLDWADVWRVKRNIEVTAGKAKTRQRRLVEINTALAAWLQPFRQQANGALWPGHEVTFQQKFTALCDDAKVPRKPNGLRHSFCSYHYVAHANENLTAAQAGNSPAMIHSHYKGLATKKEARQWFAVKPKRTHATNVISLAVAGRQLK